MAEKQIQAAIYARVSSERQAEEDRVSIDVQIDDCRAYGEAKGYKIVEIYVDKTKYRTSKGKLVQPSGQRKDRPSYRAMIKAALAGEIDVILAWKEDRLYRGLYAAIPFSEMLDQLGKNISVELVKENFDRRMLGIKAALGKIESDNIKERMIAGRRARLMRGEAPGSSQAKYGYQRGADNHLEVNEAEAAIVKKIYEWYVSGENNMQIRRRLNAMGVKPRKSKLWSKATIGKILTFEGYATGISPTTLDGETFEIPCPPIISMDVWQKSRKVREGNKYTPRNLKKDFLCAGIAYCGCGWKLKPIARSIRHGKKVYKSIAGMYTCQRKGVNPESMPPTCAYQTGSKKVDEYVWGFVKEICRNPALLNKVINEKIAGFEQAESEIEAERQAMQKQLDDVTMERQWVITAARKGQITAEDMEMQLAALDIHMMAVQREIRQRDTMAAAKHQAEALSQWAERYLSEIGAGIELLETDPETLTEQEQGNLYAELEAWRYDTQFPDDKMAQLKKAIFEEKRRLVRNLISKVVISKDPEQGRIITPILALELPVENVESFGYGHQSLEYINSLDWRAGETATH